MARARFPSLRLTVGLGLLVVLVLLISRTCATDPEAPPPSDGPVEPAAHHRDRAPKRADDDASVPSAVASSSTEESLPQEASFTVEVEVRQRGSGDAVPGAHVRIVRASQVATGSDVEDAVVAVSDRAGRATVSVPAAWRPRDLKASAVSPDGHTGTVGATTIVREAATTLWVDPTASLRGRVEWTGSLAANDVRVFAFCPNWAESPKRRSFPVHTDGTFEIRGAARYVSLLAVAPGHAPSVAWIGRTDDGSLVPGETTNVTLRLGEAATRATISVRRDSGDFVPLGTPILYSTGGAWMRALVDRDGACVLDHAEGGRTLKLYAYPTWLREGTQPRTPNHRLEIAAGQWESGATFTLPSVAHLRLRFLDQSKRPLEGIPLALYRREEGQESALVEERALTATGEFDGFVVGSHAPGSYELRLLDETVVWRGSAGPTLTDLTDVRLEALDSVRVRLVDAEGQPVSALHVACGVTTHGEPESASIRDVTAGQGFRRFRDARGVVVAVRRSSRGNRVVRVRFEGFGHRDIPLQGAGDVIDVPFPRELGGVRLTFGFPAPARCSISLTRVDEPKVTYTGRLASGGRAIAVHGMLPGVYTWKTIGSSLPAERSGEGFEVVAGRQSALELR